MAEVSVEDAPPTVSAAVLKGNGSRAGGGEPEQAAKANIRDSEARVRRSGRKRVIGFGVERVRAGRREAYPKDDGNWKKFHQIPADMHQMQY
ncbi:MAG: hypothetical protein IPK53_04950 [bacterium]|nr:hypothetical protein [bacterium]